MKEKLKPEYKTDGYIAISVSVSRMFLFCEISIPKKKPLRLTLVILPLQKFFGLLPKF